MASGDLITRIASQDTLLSVQEVVRQIAAVIVDASAIDWKSLFEARATGEVYSTKFYYYENSTSPDGEKMNASAGLKAVPSTKTVRGRDDFTLRNAFSFIDCDFVCDDSGKRVPQKIKGQSGFSYTGKVDVGVLTPPTYWAIEEHENDGYYIVHFSDKKHDELEMVATPWCRDPAGNEMGYGLVTKYYAGKIDGILYSSSGLPCENFISYQSGHTALQKKGVGYYGSGSERTAYLLCMLWIKYATKNSQNVFNGCIGYNHQLTVAEQTTDVDYVVIHTADANKLYVGSYVCVGDPGENTNYDRNQAYMRNIVARAKVLKIEEIAGTSNSKVYLSGDAFAATANTKVSTMPCGSGETDDVLGVDGYVANDGMHPFKIGGIEEGIGAYFVSMNELWNKETATTVSYYVRGNAAWSSSSVANYTKVATVDLIDTNDAWIGDISIDIVSGAIYPRAFGTGDRVGVGDRIYKGGTGTGLREALLRGNLWNWSLAGFAFSYLGSGVSDAAWCYAAAV